MEKTLLFIEYAECALFLQKCFDVIFQKLCFGGWFSSLFVFMISTGQQKSIAFIHLKTSKLLQKTKHFKLLKKVFGYAVL